MPNQSVMAVGGRAILYEFATKPDETDGQIEMTEGAEHVARPSAVVADRPLTEGHSAQSSTPGDAASVTALMRAANAAGFPTGSAAGETGRIRRSSVVGQAGGPVDEHTENRIRAARRGGTGLAGPVRRQMEGAFGADLGDVRVHVGPESTELNNRVQAKAFAVGSDLFFRDGLPDTSTSDGQHLLAHELAHTQQAASRVSRSTAVIRRTREEEWLDVQGAFEGDSRPKSRKVFSSDNFKAIRAAVDAVAEARGAAEVRALRLGTLDTAIGVWLGGASADNPRRDVVQQLRVEVARQQNFLAVLNPVVKAMNDYRWMEAADVTAALGQIDGLLANPLAQLDVYAELVELIASRREAVADRLAVDAASAAASAAGIAAIQAALGADRTPAAIAREYRVFLDGNNMQYSPTGSETDVFVKPAGPADCSSVAQGLAKTARGLDVDAKRVDCGTSSFLTAALPPTALPGEANIQNITGDTKYDGRRFYFPTHYVADVAGTRFCPVVGAPWVTGTHVEISGAVDGSGFSADLAGTPFDGEEHELTKAFPDDGVGVARVGDKTYLVRLVPTKV